jgi:hypothetical protein
MYKELFYLISSFVMRFKAVRQPQFSSFLYISIIKYSNIITVFMFLGYFFDFNLYRDYNFDYIYICLPLGIFIMIVDYFTIYLKREAIIEKYNSQNEISKYKVLLYKFYIIATFILLIVSGSLTKTLFDDKNKQKEQEKIKITIPKLDPKGDPSKTY